MGSSISVCTGFGVILPWGEDDEFDFSQNPYFKSFPNDEDDEEDEDEYRTYSTWDIEENLNKRFPLLQAEPTYVHDWTGESALFIEKSIQNNWGGGVFHSNTCSTWAVTLDEQHQLEEACALLGVSCTPSFLVAVSYG